MMRTVLCLLLVPERMSNNRNELCIKALVKFSVNPLRSCIGWTWLPVLWIACR
jgi:hypothetical protein